MGKFKDLTGMRFGKLTVIERAENYISPSGQSQTVWKCKCDCGNPDMIKVAAKHLLSNKTKSCECKKHCTPTSFEDLTGQRFGRLTVIKRVENHISPNGRSRTMWECQCDCDNKRRIILSNIKLFQGDCLELMKDIPDESIDFICTDLPFGSTKNKWDCRINLESLWGGV